MIHLNGNILCAVDTETTGLRPGYNEIIQIAVLPLDFTLNPRKDLIPFILKLKPQRPENIDSSMSRSMRKRAADALVNGIDPELAAELFIEWCAKSLKLPERRKICPLGHNWPFDAAFIKEWLGPNTFDFYFSGHFRDTMAIASFINDVADRRYEQYIFPKLDLSYVANCLKIRLTDRNLHDALYDAMTTAEVYKRQCQLYDFPNPKYIDIEIPDATTFIEEVRDKVHAASEDDRGGSESVPQS